MPINEKTRRVLITGASRGLGRNLALTYGREGHSVLVHYHRESMAALEVAQLISKQGGVGLAYPADIRYLPDVRKLVGQVQQRWGGVDIVIHNAGILTQDLLLRHSEDGWNDTIRTNLTGSFHVIQETVKMMYSGTGGHIVTIGSRTGLCGAAGLSAYSASKAGLIGLTKEVAREVARFNIRINCVLPGYLPTDLGKSASKTTVDRMLAENVLGRFTPMEEVIRMIYSLSLTESISGQVFQLDSRIS
jgi:3-oxoacyl-[acyl-carrier protein] reductase